MINNPILRKELLLRFRLRQTKQVTLTLVGLSALGVLYLYYISLSWMMRQNTAPRDIWMMVAILQFLLLALLAPSTTANAISQEREQQTWEMLTSSRLTPKEIILGKLVGRVAPLVGIMLLLLPLEVLCLLKGAGRSDGYFSALTLDRWLLTLLTTLMTAVFFATFGLFMSWRLKRTLYALLASYAFGVGFLTVGTLLLTGALETLFGGSHLFDWFPALWVNPGYLIAMSIEPEKSHHQLYVLCGLALYGVATLLMVAKMIFGFRRHAYE